MSKSTNIPEITTLRLFFMLMIFVHHCDVTYGGGACAVSGFFLISGFCMTLGYGTKVLNEDFSWKRFMLKRAVKLYPVHWICLLLTWILSLDFHFDFQTITSFGMNAALLQSWVPFQWMYFSFNSPSWYLCNIMFFAAVFPYLMRFINRLSMKGKVLSLTIPIGIIILLSVLMPTPLRHAWLYINPISRLVDCYIGMYLALVYLRFKQNVSLIERCRQHVGLIDFAIVLFFVLVAGRSIFKIGVNHLYQTVYWIPNILLLCIIVLRSSIDKESFISKILNCRIVTYLGECSLSFYLLHCVVMRIMELINEPFWTETKMGIGGCIALVFTFIIARVSYQLIEQRLTKYLNNKLLNSSI